MKLKITMHCAFLAALFNQAAARETCLVKSDCTLNADPLCSADCVNGECIGICAGNQFVDKKPHCVDPIKDCPSPPDNYCGYSCLQDECVMWCQAAPQPVSPNPDPTVLDIDKPLCMDPAKDCPESKDPLCSYGCQDSECQMFCQAAPQPPVVDDGKCKSGKNCKSGEYCANGKCLAEGKCSRSIDCVNPANTFASPTCDGFFRCKKGECVRKCTRLSCRVSKPPVETCDTDPCDPKNCNRPFASCVPSKCGGCHAKFFDAAGKRVCRKGNTTKKQTCDKSTNCADGQFCAQGTCILEGTCFRKSDCMIADNVVPHNTCAKDKKKDRLVCKQNRCEWKC